METWTQTQILSKEICGWIGYGLRIQIDLIRSDFWQRWQFFSTHLLLNEVSEKKSHIQNEVSEIFSKFFSGMCPEIRPKFFALSWQVEKSSPKNSPDFSRWRFQISKQIPNQSSPTFSQTHFCRLGSPNNFKILQFAIIRKVAMVCC